MRKLQLDPNLYKQIGLDSGALTMLGAVVHSFGYPGEYRGTVRQGRESRGVFYLTVDKNSPAAQVDIDLAALAKQAPASDDKECGCRSEDNHFTVNPRGYAVFRVSGGSGGYNVHVRRAEEAEDTPVFDSQKLAGGAIFSCTILRPGRYSVTNVLGKGVAQAVVAYPPKRGKTPYRPPEPVRIQTTESGFDPKRIKLMPAQGIVFECKSKAPSRIKIELVEPDDGPRSERKKG